MYLLKIYSEPAGLFEPVQFKNGINFVFGKKVESDQPKSSLNSIGKSTFLDLIDFCLLSSYQKSHNPRLFSAKDIMSGFYIVLEFRIGETKYVIKRSVDDPKKAFFAKLGDELIEFDIDIIRIFLCNLVFRREDYNGIFNVKWFRGLINFYLKIQKFKKDRFLDPIRYNDAVNEVETNVYLLYLLGLNNKHSNDLFKIKTDLKDITPAIKQIEKLLEEKYNLKSLTETNQNINKLRYEIKRLEATIESFQLKDEYEDVEQEANTLTQNIKEKWFQNFSERKKIEAYKESYKIPDKISTIRIKNIYENLSKDFAIQVKRTLDEAIDFRKKLSENRRLFLEEEIVSLESNISAREIEILEIEKQRAKLFSFLSAQEAIKDLTEAFGFISEKKSQLGELESNTKILNDLVAEKKEIEGTRAGVDKQIFEYVKSLTSEIDSLYELFTNIYNEIYVNNQNESGFSIDYNSRKEKLINISITMPDMFGKGKNQGRTLVYDIFVLQNSFKFSMSFPRFLIHDGIFDGVDKAHFVAIYEYFEKLEQKGIEFQYITTLNEEGHLTGKFGNADKVNPEKIEEEAIIVLSSQGKLFGKDFKNSE